MERIEGMRADKIGLFLLARKSLQVLERLKREEAEGVSNTYSMIREEAARVRAERLAKENKKSEGI
ncbi:MAG: hypothetical protein IKP03_06345 [Fibrobacter sp.]|nr:hypothetical protein [Clostridia bacterium]MBR3038576.1 hypothetical protein [Clostridia bacterium]MBR4680707.1 hypothetical protein [Fibrobacter sp.]